MKIKYLHNHDRDVTEACLDFRRVASSVEFMAATRGGRNRG